MVSPQLITLPTNLTFLVYQGTETHRFKLTVTKFDEQK